MSEKDKAAFYYEERLKGKTYQKIAEENGVTKQAIHSVLKANGYISFPFREVTEKGCIYPNLREWMNSSGVGILEFTFLVGLRVHRQSITKMRGILRGQQYPNKKFIDQMIRVTGLSYEKLFQEVV